MNNSHEESIIYFAKALKKVMEENINNQRGYDYQTAKFPHISDKSYVLPKEAVDTIENDYKLQMTKLEMIDQLISERDIASLEKIKDVYKVVAASDVKQTCKDASITTLISLSTEKDLHVSNLSTMQAYMFCNAVLTLPLEGYDAHKRVVGTPIVLDEVMLKADELDDRIAIFWKILDYCSDCLEDDMSEEEYNSVVRDSVRIASNYEKKDVPEQTKSK